MGRDRGKRALASTSKNIKARLASVIAFSFAQKEPESLSPDTINQCKIYCN